jgi:hypothetical protein
MPRSFPALVVLLFAAVSPPASGQWAGWDYDFDEEKKTWKELQAQIPPYPQPGNLVPLEVSRALGHSYYVDTTSISRGEDGVMRYTAIVKAAGGASNVSFEGMRCETREYKVYALGRSDGTWVRARDPKWQRVVYKEATPHHSMLFRDYLCPFRFSLPAPKDVASAIKRGQSLNPNADFRE